MTLLRSRPHGRLALAVLLAVGLGAHAQAAGRRALVIGINDYGAGRRAAVGKRVWENLDGAVDDARDFRDLLAGRYGFRPDEVELLLDGQASRAGILAALDRLLDGAEAGSVRILYFAGHGSQVANSKSPEADKLDETLVPADGADIRDKELARRFDRAARAGVVLTVILDACHSGSATRGLHVGRARRLAPPPTDVADGAPAPDPTRSGAVVLAAAEDRELAREIEDGGRWHGAFTLALISALASSPADESLERVFKKTRAILQRDGRGQEPDLRGPPGRLARSLVGATPSAAPARATVAVRAVEGDVIELQGGRAEELAPGCELVTASARIRVVAVTGLSSSRAKLVSGSLERVRPGDLFELDRWVAPDGPSLTVRVPPPLAAGELAAAAAAVAELHRLRPDVAITDDPTEVPPSHVVSWDGRGWSLDGPDGTMALGAHLSAAALQKERVYTLFLALPPPPDVAAALELGARSRNGAVAVGNAAQYLLAGRLRDGKPQLAWVQLGLGAARLQTGSLLPPRGEWVDAARPTAARELTDQAVKLARIRGWLLLENARPSFFPYRVGLRDAAGGWRPGGVVTDGELYQVVLRADGQLPAVVLPRYVYVFTIDEHGEAKRLYPAGGGAGGENRLPAPSAAGAPAEIVLPTKFKVSAPFGIDTYILLATDEPVDPDVLQFSGVRAASPGPLERLLARTGEGLRGEPIVVPTSWTIDRASFESVARP